MILMPHCKNSKCLSCLRWWSETLVVKVRNDWGYKRAYNIFIHIQLKLSSTIMGNLPCRQKGTLSENARSMQLPSNNVLDVLPLGTQNVHKIEDHIYRLYLCQKMEFLELLIAHAKWCITQIIGWPRVIPLQRRSSHMKKVYRKI